MQEPDRERPQSWLRYLWQWIYALVGGFAIVLVVLAMFAIYSHVLRFLPRFG